MFAKWPPLAFVTVILVLVGQAFCKSHAPLSYEEDCLQFLHSYMPAADRQLLDRQFLTQNVHFALKARELTPWASGVPWDLFLNDVLPYAVFNERRDDWRGSFFDTLSPLVAGAPTMASAASIINSKIWNLWNLTFVGGQTPQTMSPLQVLAAQNASCIGFSVLLIDSLRSVGIPARAVGTPEWNDGAGGNHDWVEVWFNSQWNFIDAYDGTKFNEGWFVPSPVKYQRPNSGKHSIYATSFQPTAGGVHFPMAWDYEDLSVPGIDFTQWYLDIITVTMGWPRKAQSHRPKDRRKINCTRLMTASRYGRQQHVTDLLRVTCHNLRRVISDI